jgi:endonuclease/exonuclease/phosphatase family metal-dependent hydrolase
MRVATWNLERCPPRRAARAGELRALMAKIGADVWILTETHRDFAPSSAHRLISHSADASDRDAAAGECWVAIWSSLPAERVELSADLERTCAARVAASVVIIGTVLPWLTDNRHGGIRGAAAFRARLEEQVVDWQRFASEPGSRLCVAGDFNQDLCASDHYYGSQGGREALRTALASVGLECLTGDADDPLGGTQELACIDHICVRNLQVSRRPRSRAWPTPGELQGKLTDHYGVYADLQLA